MTQAEAVLRALLSGPAQSGLREVAPGVELQSGSNAVEVSNGVVTVNLSFQARTLEPQQLHAARVAIANTLTELPDVDYVNVLVEGRDAQGYFGRSQFEAPETDGLIRFSCPRELAPGSYVDVRITRALEYDLIENKRISIMPFSLPDKMV